ncbi:hypothetical protein L7750_13515 [Xenorhabdus bovienii]|uniref:hypothetical protein n=1 Tax=Xenorhabdus bovienii TaxID=40576 RepID=UPI001EE0D68B|nr:hypothetical protein [Xenorhabdus bovienii]MCG3471380.1 hypothetical protein [Xenorhabdus bovienii]
MATTTLHFPDIKNGWYISYFFQKFAGYDYTVKIQDSVTGKNYATWYKSGEWNSKDSNSFLYTGENGNLICIVDCPSSSQLDNTWAESLIVPSSGEPTLGRTYCAAFEDHGGKLEYNNLFVCLVGWKYNDEPWAASH